MTQRTKYIAVLLATLIAITGCTRAAPQKEEATPTPIPTPIVPVKPTYQVQRGEVVKSIQFTGRIAPVVEEELFFRTSGYVGTVYVKRNQQVKTGDLLGELETTDLQNQLAQAQAELEAIQISAGRQITEATAALKIAELRLATIKAENPDLQVVSAEVGLEWAQTGLQDAKKAYQEAVDRYWEPDKVREAAARGVRDAELNLQVAEAQYQQALQARLAHSYNVQIQEQEVALARLRLQELQAGLDIQRAQLAVQRLEAQLADARVVAPFDGLLLSLSLTEGRLVEGYKPVAIVADVSALELSADLTDKQLQELTEDMPVTIVPLSRPSEEFKGSVRRLPYPYGGGGRSTGVEDEDKSTRVTLETPASEARFELGDLARMTVVLERKDDALWLPPQAIRTFEGRKFVVVQEGDAQLRVDVKVGIESEDRVEILEGLTEGQVVIGQ
jgi:RND family efflux transporter MFP subunit